MLARAAATDRQPQLDRLCIHTVIESALAAGLAADAMLFINCEAVTAHVSRADDEVLARGAARLQLVFELTERSLLTDPPALLRKVAALHADGFAVAFDDVGANLGSLALLDIICPDIIKLDLAVVQSLPRYQQARTWAAVLDHHERAGATILAEGIETAEHLDRALALGATLGQGFRFGRPSPLTNHRPHRARGAPRIHTRQSWLDIGSPFDAIAGRVPTRTERKDSVLALSRLPRTASPRRDGSTDSAHHTAARRVLHHRHQRPIPSARRELSVGGRLRPRPSPRPGIQCPRLHL